MAGTDEAHGLTVETVPREKYRQAGPQIPVGTEPCDGGLASELSDHGRVPLGQADSAGDAALERTLRRIAPTDGSRVLLVAASFNSAI